MMRRAISPRLAIRTLFIAPGPGPPASLGGQRGDVLTRLDQVLVLDEEALQHGVAVGFHLVEVLHHLDEPDHLPVGNAVAFVDVRILVGTRSAIEGPRNRRRDRRLVGHFFAPLIFLIELWHPGAAAYLYHGPYLRGMNGECDMYIAYWPAWWF